MNLSIILSDGNDMIKLNWSAEIELNGNNTISDNIYNSFKQLNESDHFCSLWSSEKPISDSIVMILITVISILDFAALIIVMIDYDCHLSLYSNLILSTTFPHNCNLFISYCNKYVIVPQIMS
uniref:Uncharacterized protein n=1 Tax=Onchocerca volvulus TaxID=6282 RepID=A0A8R1TQ49_ONCVO